MDIQTFVQETQRQLNSIERRLNDFGAGAGQANTASNIGAAGIGLYQQKVGVDLQFRNINAASARISVALDVGNNEVDIDAVEAAINHDALLNFVGDEHVAHSGVILTAGIGLTGGGDISVSRTFNVDVGIADDDIVQIDSGTVAINDYAKFTALGLAGRNYAEVLSDLSNQAAATFDWNNQNLIDLGPAIIWGSAGLHELKNSIDNGAVYITGGSAFNHGASLQFYGEDHAGLPGHVYIISGSHDASPASIIQFAYRNAGAYQAIMTLGNDRHIDIWDWVDGAMREISFGADNSGGAGFKVLRVPN